ncbi:MAG: hypothetical protein HYV27_13070 [Candidatus Hydrogenedentes bacterium]|nr:hypothetical protein [Candidatus Hydrogenedentota bacterium]
MRFVFVSLILTLGLAAGAPEPVLDNGTVRIAFDAKSGALTEVRGLSPAHGFIGGAREALWRLDLLEGAAPVTPDSAGSFRFVAEEPGALRLIWERFAPPAPPGLRVTASVRLGGLPSETAWRIAVSGAEGVKLGAVHYPRIGPIMPQAGEVLAAPVWMGERTERIRELTGNGRSIGWEYPGTLSMQCLAYYGAEGPGLLLRSDDTAALAKRFQVAGLEGGGIALEVVQIPEQGGAARTEYTAPYGVILDTFTGDWYTAAERYRAWALEQSWARMSRMRNGCTAPWVADTGLWVWNRGASGGVLQPAMDLQAHAGMPVSVFWHWWHGCSYDTGFPEYLPPREGAAPFSAALAGAHEKDVHAIVYMNQRLWGMETESWKRERAAIFAVKDAAGKVRPEVYNTFTKAPNASMCMGTLFWRNKYAAIAQAAVKLGVDGIYMDQACSSLACYDPVHGHPLGGGSYWMEGFRLLQGDIRARTAPVRQVVLAGEGCGETWLPYLDLMLSLQVSMERYAAPGAWEPTPFFHAVYHGYGVFYGNYSSLTMPPYDEKWPAEFAPAEPLKLLDQKFATQFRQEQARAFVWGQQPSLANFRADLLERRPEEMAYVLRLAKLRREVIPFLLHGTMLRPPRLASKGVEIDVSRLSIYAGQQDPVKEYRREFPPVIGSAWRAADGAVAVVLANITAEPQGFPLAIDRESWGLPETGSAYMMRDTGRADLGRVADLPAALTVELGAADACVYVFAP